MEEAKIKEFVNIGLEFFNEIMECHATAEEINVDNFDKDDIQDCMFEALLCIELPAQVLLTHNERHEIVDYWYDLYSYVPMNDNEIEELRSLKEYNKYLNELGQKRLIELWTKKDREDKM